jgi:uncharacterized protein (DUF1697 family)
LELPKSFNKHLLWLLFLAQDRDSLLDDLDKILSSDSKADDHMMRKLNEALNKDDHEPLFESDSPPEKENKGSDYS